VVYFKLPCRGLKVGLLGGNKENVDAYELTENIVYKMASTTDKARSS
jgi:hypothetical protein